MTPEAVNLLHADAALIVVDKPAGLLAVPGRGEAGRDNLAARVQAWFTDLSSPPNCLCSGSALTNCGRSAPASAWVRSKDVAACCAGTWQLAANAEHMLALRVNCANSEWNDYSAAYYRCAA